MTHWRPGGEAGTALIEFSWLALLLMVPLIYIVIAVFTVQQAAYGLTAATRAATRAYTLAPDVATADERAQQAADLALRDQGMTIEEVNYGSVHCPGGCLQPGSSVEITIRAQVPLPLLPRWLAGEDNLTIRVESTHTTPYGEYLPGR